MRLSTSVAVLGLLFILTTSVRTAEPSEVLISALIRVESGGNDRVIGDVKLKNKAYGCLQVRQPVCDDVNQRFGTHYRAEDCLGNRQLSIEICKKYLSMYAKTGADEETARIWNGGPKGQYKKSTEKYWEKVKKFL
ncbi:MAG: transglycosylase SLT domain-containing protein [Candidatus Pacebacteria bacterium]|nr:transglycosylase SLT domain-containing protein [Candidatus Paceibacterota bacterium]MDD5356522.1 transglycosylase SLT domain-containing protein [Candidatus Paceibacterota bacterium]